MEHLPATPIKTNTSTKKVLVFVFGILAAFGLDRMVKNIYQHVAPENISLNRGLSFSIPSPGWLIATLLILTTALVLLILPILFKRFSKRNSALFALALGGAASNLYDRIAFGGVLDVFHIWISWFNLADVFLIGSTTFILVSYIAKKPSSTV